MSIKILANDGIDDEGKKMLHEKGFEVKTEKVPQEKLASVLKDDYDVLLVRSATKVSRPIIEAAGKLKLIGRAGVGIDNIDSAAAKEKGIPVINTPDASSQSVAELVFAHLFSMSRFLYDSNRRMPSADTAEKFNQLKKEYSKGLELRGKTLGIIGFGRIGQTTAQIAMGLGMNILAFKLHKDEVKIDFFFFKTLTPSSVEFKIQTVPFEDLLRNSDFITLHVPFPKGAKPVITSTEIALMKNGAGLINTSRGGAIVENDLLQGLNSGKISFAALDVFEGEPVVNPKILSHPRISLSPHIGASTSEAQMRIGVEMANKIISFFSR